jgi:uncharacterized protein (TIGR00251 family)
VTIAYKKTASGITFEVYVQPRSSANAIIGCHDRALKIKLTAPPVGGAANKQCVQMLAKKLGLPKSALTIASGRASRRKTIGISFPSGSTDKTAVSSIVDWLQTLAKNSP